MVFWCGLLLWWNSSRKPEHHPCNSGIVTIHPGYLGNSFHISAVSIGNQVFNELRDTKFPSNETDLATIRLNDEFRQEVFFGRVFWNFLFPKFHKSKTLMGFELYVVLWDALRNVEEGLFVQHNGCSVILHPPVLHYFPLSQGLSISTCDTDSVEVTLAKFHTWYILDLFMYGETV